MQTGYTAKLMENGQTFTEFALGCARAFGACVTMRDAAPDAPIPERFEPDDYSVKRLAEVERELERLSKMTPDQQHAFGVLAKEKDIESHKELAIRARNEDARIDDMVRCVKSWIAPSPDHSAFKNFMLDQLHISRNGSYWDDLEAKSRAKPAIDYYDEALARAERDVEYHRNEIVEESKRVDARNRWLKQLRDSLPDRAQ